MPTGISTPSSTMSTLVGSTSQSGTRIASIEPLLSTVTSNDAALPVLIFARPTICTERSGRPPAVTVNAAGRVSTVPSA